MTYVVIWESCACARTPGTLFSGKLHLGWTGNINTAIVRSVIKHVHTSRPKWTKLVAHFSEVEMINAVCDGKHWHQPWGYEFRNGKRVYATSLEVHYPTALCNKIAATIVLALQHRNIAIPESVPLNLAARTIAQNQPATNKVAAIVSEFKTKCVALFLQDQCVWPVQHEFLQHAKLLQNVQMGSESLQSLLSDVNDQCKLWNLDVRVDVCKEIFFPCDVSVKLFGPFWSETEFVEQAVKARHPLSLDSAVPQQLLDVIRFTVKEEEAEVARVRAKFFS